MINKLEVLKNLKLGNSVAEQDRNLSNYFIDTSYTEEFIEDRYDIVKGVKGAGKTAMLVSVCQNKSKYINLKNVQLVQAINITGDPYFKRAFDSIKGELDEQKVVDVWKVYIINILWNSINERSNGSDKLEKYLKKHKLITSKEGLLEKILHAVKRIKVTNTFNHDGTATQEFGISESRCTKNNIDDMTIIDYNYIFDEIDRILEIDDYKIWVMMDRLDDAFPDDTKRSNIILKSLLYAFKDICVYENLKVKIFIRNDIFANITESGFTSLTHVASKTMAPIEWDRNKLEQLLVQRLLFNDKFKEYLKYNNINIESREDIFSILFKKQVDTGSNNPDTIGWIINHIKDGQGIYTPRDFIGLIDTARQYQVQELKENTSSNDDNFMIGATALRKAYLDISKQKLETQIYAEYPNLREVIEKFKNSKSEHNEKTLKKLLGREWRSKIRKLVKIGFVEEKHNSWKIPFLYRYGLNISQGKAF